MMAGAKGNCRMTIGSAHEDDIVTLVQEVEPAQPSRMLLAQQAIFDMIYSTTVLRTAVQHNKCIVTHVNLAVPVARYAPGTPPVTAHLYLRLAFKLCQAAASWRCYSGSAMIIRAPHRRQARWHLCLDALQGFTSPERQHRNTPASAGERVRPCRFLRSPPSDNGSLRWEEARHTGTCTPPRRQGAWRSDVRRSGYGFGSSAAERMIRLTRVGQGTLWPPRQPGKPAQRTHPRPLTTTSK